MIRPAAGVGDERREPLPVELRDQRRGELVGDEHQRSFEVPEQIERIAVGAQVHAQPADDVGDVALALAQVGVVDADRTAPRLRRARAASADSAFSRSVANDRRGPLDQHRIVEHQQLRVEQVGVVGAGGRRDALLDVLELLARLRARGIEPLELARRRAARGCGSAGRACRASPRARGRCRCRARRRVRSGA